MASVAVSSRYYYDLRASIGPQGLVPRADTWRSWTVNIDFATFWVSARPILEPGSSKAALCVHDTSYQQADVGHGGVTDIQTTVYATFINSGLQPIFGMVVYLSYVTP
jgi:hypothetical protein